MSGPTMPRPAAAIAERHRRSEAAMQRVHDAVTALRREHARPTLAAVARRAGVSRTFIYDNIQARTAVATAMAATDQARVRLRQEIDGAQQAGWRERALNAEDALTAAHTEITRQRDRIGELLGQLRDLQAEWDDETIARITTENATLKQRVRQLTTDNHTMEERLAAARSTLRFQDRRIADLEGRIADPAVT
jgi:chromosome segregation ATPase